ncbi:hypothetical protein CR513_17398, partial [Mucuna pruriens]
MDPYKLKPSQSSCHITLNLVETVIIPIPKIDKPKNLKDFKSINLCNVFHKLKLHLVNLIRPFHCSIIPNRIIHKKKGKYGFLTFKIDFEKTYDHVYWNFLKLILTEFSFPSHIINLITSCTTFASLSLKWNNERLEIGDLMSPYLFFLCMEKLTILKKIKNSTNGSQ